MWLSCALSVSFSSGFLKKLFVRVRFAICHVEFFNHSCLKHVLIIFGCSGDYNYLLQFFSHFLRTKEKSAAEIPFFLFMRSAIILSDWLLDWQYFTIGARLRLYLRPLVLSFSINRSTTSTAFCLLVNKKEKQSKFFTVSHSVLLLRTKFLNDRLDRMGHSFHSSSVSTQRNALFRVLPSF